jgi:hypothetical protein
MIDHYHIPNQCLRCNAEHTFTKGSAARIELDDDLLIISFDGVCSACGYPMLAEIEFLSPNISQNCKPITSLYSLQPDQEDLF